MSQRPVIVQLVDKVLRRNTNQEEKGWGNGPLSMICMEKVQFATAKQGQC